MKSPYPGMDPYLENPALWRGFHARLIGTMSRMLLPQVTPAYWVDVEDLVYIDSEEGQARRIGPDVHLSTRSRTRGRVSPTAMADAPAAVVEAPLPLWVREHALKVIRRADREVVTIIELLSPTNKRLGADGRAAYLHKRAEVLGSDRHLMEIDLLRGGARPPVRGRIPECEYVAFVHRRPKRPRAEVFPMRLRERLPVLPVPLARPDPDVALDLGEAVRVTYEEGRYDLELDYARGPEPPLAGALAAWSASLLKRAGLRRA